MTKTIEFTFLLAVLACACGGGPSQCSVDLCSGCCDAAGVCQGGQATFSCGANGNVCAACVAGQSCQAGVCAQASGAGGGDGGGVGGGVGGGAPCTPETDAALCQRLSVSCGPITGSDNCGQQRVVSTCGMCGSGTFCSRSGACACQPESNAVFCTRLGATCGSITGVDNCGTGRTVVTCGTGCPSPQTCGGSGTPNRCGCSAETDARFCTRMGQSCGPVSGADNCGLARTVATCGTCAGTNQCTNGACSCPETNAAFCTRQQVSCGPLAGTDLCGNPRNVANCGTCTGSLTCGGGTTAGVCGCTAQSDAAMCAAAGKECGSFSAVDACGHARALNCGACTGLQTCGGGGQANTCGCTPETNGAFCSRLGAQCGALTAADNCGTSRTVASCGACSAGQQTCGGGGQTNQCGCTAETSAQLCAAAGNNCGALSVTDSCGGLRSLTCGTCGSGQVCGADGLVGQCSTPNTLTVTQTGGRPLPVAPTLLDNDILAIRAVSPTEVWVITSSMLLRVRPGSAQPYFLNGLSTAGGRPNFWSLSASDVWLAVGQLLFHFDGATWSPVNAGFAAGSTLTAIHGTASDDLWVASALSTTPDLRHFDGSTWSPFTVPLGSGIITDLAGQTRGRPFVLRNGTVYQYNGLSYVALPRQTRSPSRLWVSASGAVFTLGASCSFYSYSYFEEEVQRYQAGAWVSLYSTAPSSLGCTSYSTRVDIDGTADDNVWFDGHIVTTSQRVTTLPGQFVAPTAAGAGFVANATTLYQVNQGTPTLRFSAGAGQHCGQGYVDASGATSMVCQGQLGRVDGTGFTLTAASALVTAIFTSPATSLWVALRTGAIEKRSASGTTVYSGYLGSVFVALAATSDSNVWAVTADGGALHFDGSQWTPTMIPVGAGATLSGLAASSSSAWAWGASRIFQWSGTAWVSVALPPFGYVTQLVLFNSNPWVVMSQSSPTTNVLYSLSGSTWTSQRSVTNSFVLWADASGVLTQSGSGSTGTLERWSVGGSATSLLALTDSQNLRDVQWLTMPNTHELLYSANDHLYRARF